MIFAEEEVERRLESHVVDAALVDIEAAAFRIVLEGPVHVDEPRSGQQSEMLQPIEVDAELHWRHHYHDRTTCATR